MSKLTLTLGSTIRLSSGYELPVVGLGVYQNDDCSPACLAALKHGYRHIDSARMYKNEEEVGKSVRESGIARGDVFVTSKVNNPEHGYETALAAVDDSLNKFGFEYIDLMLIHSPLSDKERRLQTWKGLIEAKKQGKVRTIGVSNYGPKHLEEIREAGLETPSVNQVELHPLCQQKEIVEYCTKHGIIVEAYSPLIRGKWTDKIVEIAKKYDKDPAQLLIRWSLQRKFVPLPKSSQPARVISNANIFDFEISEEDMSAINALDRGKDGAVTWNPVDAP
ncbi:Aldo/keto reductase [Trametes versicolor FP-101664 SS1]|uniref:Aldo/keto reductase n=1 Tax=Trametes versicolor (strain FP-101664) TaxID=717944 RepID=UPI0004621BB5|nr:Aldo/keto reductase [Trametes versicolor FP-101664 SS1]EIW62562.1 Aldo/keto reductase [Trametes versicolor FP-101664 SS1]